MGRELLFSVTKEDFKIETFKAGGPGGQNQNKRETGVRITHPLSGAVGEGREYRSQEQNRRAAFKRLVESTKFKIWHKKETARLTGKQDFIRSYVDKIMSPPNLKIEVVENGEWVEQF